MDFLEKYNFWKKHATHPTVVESLRQMEGNNEQIKNAFYGELQFGTGGLRGVMMAGTDRLNVYTVFKATEGVARYMLAHSYTSCAITYDSRLNSELFSKTAAVTLAHHGIKVYITKECMPTPFLSFMLRDLHCDLGINLTASHNPSEYNGYKVYDYKGCQMVDAGCKEIIGYISQVDPFEREIGNFDDYLNKTIFYIDDCVEQRYIDAVVEQGLDTVQNLKVVYTPLNGAGWRIVPKVLKTVGVQDLIVVPEQATPNGNFTTCPYPNPEKKEALKLAAELLQQSGADIVLATDPDSDRLGVAVNNGSEVTILGGNEVAVILCDYVLMRLTQQNKMPQNPLVVKTIVTTIMANKIAGKYGVQIHDVLTGFKYIGDVIGKLEDNGEKHRYVFGFEESCGYLKGTYVRDKDGVVASMLVAECASYYKAQGKTLVDRLNELFEEFGTFYQDIVSYKFEGVTGAERKNQLLAELRKNPPTHLGDSPIVATCDFLTQTQYDLPKADVIRFNAQNGSQLIVRPSGTEPLIKCYLTVQGDKEGNKIRFAEIKALTDRLFSK
ncbi:MAG: phospho-sugar mutase [Clostridia bacterium]|nr:phospho-sugar mutase [Clostridia bacterium]